MSIFDPPNRDNERPVGEIERQCEDNWLKIPEDVRRRCIDVIRKKAPDDMLATWKSQYQRGMRVGSDDLFFHLGVGMQVRNTLRAVLLDDGLPMVKYEDGSEHQNWDDFYIGALHQLCREVLNDIEDVIFSPIKDN